MSSSGKRNQLELVLQKAPSGQTLVQFVNNSSVNYLSHFPPEFIQKFAEVYQNEHFIDQLEREENPEYVEIPLKNLLFSHYSPNYFKGKKLLDFGCGTGASTCILQQLLPETSITGMDFREEHLQLGTFRAQFNGLKKINFVQIQHPLTPELKEDFDVIVLNAVVEHLLPNERKTVLQQLWKHLKPGGTIFINETPHRYFPVETHTSGFMPFINYLPDKWAFKWVKSKKEFRHYTDEELLRAGIRGSTVEEIFNILNKTNNAKLLQPERLGIKNTVDLFFENLPKNRLSKWAILLLKIITKGIFAVSGYLFTPTIAFAIRKKD